MALALDMSLTITGQPSRKSKLRQGKKVIKNIFVDAFFISLNKK